MIYAQTSLIEKVTAIIFCAIVLVAVFHLSVCDNMYTRKIFQSRKRRDTFQGLHLKWIICHMLC